jgi:hypothetical protein
MNTESSTSQQLNMNIPPYLSIRCIIECLTSCGANIYIAADNPILGHIKD